MSCFAIFSTKSRAFCAMTPSKFKKKTLAKGAPRDKYTMIMEETCRSSLCPTLFGNKTTMPATTEKHNRASSSHNMSQRHRQHTLSLSFFPLPDIEGFFLVKNKNVMWLQRCVGYWNCIDSQYWGSAQQIKSIIVRWQLNLEEPALCTT